jgi:hypothetical protein
MWSRACVALLVLLPFHAAAAQEFWETKPYAQWSKAETEKMLQDSPWAQHVTLSRVVMAGFSTTQRGVTSVGNPAAVAEAQHSEIPYLIYTAQLRSALPVRQAVVRQRQIAEKYDSMSAHKRAALDAKTDAYLARPQDDIVVYITWKSNVGNYADQVKRYWKQQTYDLLKNTVFLTVGRDRLAPVGFAATDTAFQFNFERPAEILREGSVTLEFTHPTVGTLTSETVRIEFKLDRMLVNGHPAL